jgi:hypothetical protein
VGATAAHCVQKRICDHKARQPQEELFLGATESQDREPTWSIPLTFYHQVAIAGSSRINIAMGTGGSIFECWQFTVGRDGHFIDGHLIDEGFRPRNLIAGE